MRKKYLSLAMLAMAWLLGSSTAWAQHDHQYENGICVDEECQAPGRFEEPKQAEDGFYELYNVGNIEWIAWATNEGLIDLDCRLMNDIDFMGIENLHSPIGPNTGKKYNATFDGQGHRIMNMIINRPNTERQGFFGCLRGNPNTRGEATIIKNLIIDKSCSINGAKRTGGICGSGQNNAMPIYIINCINEAEVISSSNNVAGILGGSESSHPQWKILNCVNTGTITCTNDSHEGAAITSWCGDNANTVIENCINIGEVIGMDGSGRNMYRHSGSLTARNNYDFSITEGGVQGYDHDLTTEDLKSGKACYQINSGLDEIAYYQNLGEDEHPVPLSTHKQVYLQGELLCDGTSLEGGTYTNTPQEPVIPDHESVGDDFYCIHCGKINDKFCQEVDGVYQLNSLLDLQWFAAFVNEGHTTINAALNTDIDFSGTDFPGIGTRANGYKGAFDGKFHVISNLDMSYRTDDWSGFFNFLNGGATVQNLTLDESCIICGNGNVGLIGGSTGAGDIHLTNLGMRGDCMGTAGGVAGILGCNTGSSAKIYMTNCYSTGFYTGAKESAAICAWLGSNGAVVKNCWTCGSASGIQNEEKYCFRHDNATITNCYSIFGNQCIIYNEEEIETGALCYKLNGDQSDIAWYQNLNGGERDNYPTFMPGHKQVYPATKLECDGTFNPDETTFTNDASETGIKPHQYVDGFCSYCHHEDPDYPFIRVFANADHDAAGGYTNVMSNDGSGLAINNSVAEHWNQQYFNSYQPITGLEAGVYKLRVQGYSRIRQWNEEVYGEGKLSDENVEMYHNSQYYAEVNGKRIANLFKDIAEEGLEESVKETENYCEANGLYIPNSLAAANKYFRKGMYWNTPLYFAVESEEDVVNIGVENHIYLYGNWTVWDTWRLEHVGDITNDNLSLICNQQRNNIQTLSDLEAQSSLMDAYESAQENLETATTLEDIMNAAHILSTNPQAIRLSHLAYKDYSAFVQEIKEKRDSRDDLNGPMTDLLDKYLSEYEEDSEELAHGTYLYIMEEKPLSVEELQAEIDFLNQLYTDAVSTSIAEGSSLDVFIKNAKFTEDGNFAQWNQEISRKGDAGSNFSSNSGFTDIYPVAGTWNTAFNVWQDIDQKFPNGIYELTAPAFYRPGGNGQGDETMYIPASLYINDYYTPVLSIYDDMISFEDAINGVNCRIDPANDPDAPHNGEYLDAHDYEFGTTGMYFPEQRQAVSFAFGGGRYVNHAYAIVTDGKIRLGITNAGDPWYESGMTMWGEFKLTFRGQSAEAMDKMLENFSRHAEKLGNDNIIEQEYFFCKGTLANINTLIGQAKSETDNDKKYALLQQINDAFNSVKTDRAAYAKLTDLMDYCYNEGDNTINKSMETTDEDEAERLSQLADEFYNTATELQEHLLKGDLTSEEAKKLYEDIQDRESIGGGVYIVGDLLDAEGNKMTYGAKDKAYLLKKVGEGKYEGTFKVQDRTGQPNANSRGGVYFTRLESIYRCNVSNRRFVTPATTSFAVTNNGGSDFQMNGGEFKVTLDIINNTVDFEVIEYPWQDRVFVVGTVNDNHGEYHRWKNDEMCPLFHQGDGVYEGDVDFRQDDRDNIGYLTFTIFGCRATTGLYEFNYNAARSGWNEGRYGSEQDKLIVEDGEVVGDLIRNSDRKWMVAWDNEAESQTYHITFDMNHRTVSIKKGSGNGINDVMATGTQAQDGIYTLTGVRVEKATKGVYIMNSQKVLVK